MHGIDERVKWQVLVTPVMKLRSPEREGISHQAKNSASWLWLCVTVFFQNSSVQTIMVYLHIL